MKTLLKLVIVLAVVIALGVFVVPMVARQLLPISYEDTIERCAEEYDLPPELIAGVIRAESSWRESVVSSAGAVGLMQLTPETFTWLQSKTGETYDESALKNPEINIRYGSYYLSYLRERFSDEKTQLAAYNAGPNRVQEWLKNPEYSDDGVTLKKIPIAETEKYVDRIELYQKLYRYIYFS